MKTKDIDSNINTNAEKLEKQSNNISVEHLKHIKAFDKLKSVAKLHQNILKEIFEYKTKKNDSLEFQFLQKIIRNFTLQNIDDNDPINFFEKIIEGVKDLELGFKNYKEEKDINKKAGNQTMFYNLFDKKIKKGFEYYFNSIADETKRDKIQNIINLFEVDQPETKKRNLKDAKIDTTEINKNEVEFTEIKNKQNVKNNISLHNFPTKIDEKNPTLLDFPKQNDKKISTLFDSSEQNSKIDFTLFDFSKQNHYCSPKIIQKIKKDILENVPLDKSSDFYLKETLINREDDHTLPTFNRNTPEINKKIDIGLENAQILETDNQQAFLNLLLALKTYKNIAHDIYNFNAIKNPNKIMLIINQFLIELYSTNGQKINIENFFEKITNDDEKLESMKKDIQNETDTNKKNNLKKTLYVLINDRLAQGLKFFMGFLINDENKCNQINEMIEIIKKGGSSTNKGSNSKTNDNNTDESSTNLNNQTNDSRSKGLSEVFLPKLNDTDNQNSVILKTLQTQNSENIYKNDIKPQVDNDCRNKPINLAEDLNYLNNNDFDLNRQTNIDLTQENVEKDANLYNHTNINQKHNKSEKGAIKSNENPNFQQLVVNNNGYDIFTTSDKEKAEYFKLIEDGLGISKLMKTEHSRAFKNLLECFKSNKSIAYDILCFDTTKNYNGMLCFFIDFLKDVCNMKGKEYDTETFFYDIAYQDYMFINILERMKKEKNETEKEEWKIDLYKRFNLKFFRGLRFFKQVNENKQKKDQIDAMILILLNEIH
ncbi:hypothetical protein GVAV_000643 [Gurleya vavrai]